jgi:hypothetical protein
MDQRRESAFTNCDGGRHMRYVFAILLGVALTSTCGPQTDQRLAAERTKIDAVDRRLVARLNERATLVREIGRLKQQSGAAVSDLRPTSMSSAARPR